MTQKSVVINGNQTTVPLSDELTFETFLNGLNESLVKENQVISVIKVDGKELSESEEISFRKHSLESMGDIEVVTMNPMDLAHETLSTLDQYADRLILTIQRAAEHYKQNNFLTADAYFTKAIDGLDLFVQTIGGVKTALRIGLNPKIALTEASLVSIMNDLLDAKRKNNNIFLAELLEKDLTENLNEWKTQAFPAMKAWKSA